MRRLLLILVFLLLFPIVAAEKKIKHKIFITGGKNTLIIDEEGKVVRQFAKRSRDGYVRTNGNVVIAFSHEVKEITPSGKVIFHYKLNRKENKEISTVQPLEKAYLIVEMGQKPRLREVSSSGEVLVEIPLEPETENTHMQTRMARKLANGNYLVPHLLAFAVKEYDSTGKVVSSIKTDSDELGGRESKHWPFSVIRRTNGNTLISCTRSREVIEVDKKGKVVWKITKEDLGEKGDFDACGIQLLPNGNLVIAAYGPRKAADIKLFEVNRDKEVVWTFNHPAVKAIHTFQILTTNGELIDNPLK